MRGVGEVGHGRPMKSARLVPLCAVFLLAGCSKPSQELCEEFADHVTELTVKDVNEKMGESVEAFTRAQIAARRDDDIKKCLETGSVRKIKCMLKADTAADAKACAD